MKTVYLIGFMGAGKTTIGKELANKWGRSVFDTDHEIEKITGTSISAIFTSKGENSFRIVESEMLKKLPIYDAIVTTGGGIVLRKENRNWMKQNGSVIFLNVSPEEVLRRLTDDSTRPLLSSEKEKTVHDLLKTRLPLYQEASHHQILTDGKTPDEIILEIEACLKR